MSTLAPPTKTKQLGAGATRGGLGAGQTKRTGNTRTRRTGGTTGTGMDKTYELEHVKINGHEVFVKPKQLVQKHESKPVEDKSNIGRTEGEESEKDSQSKDTEKNMKKEEKKKEESSVHSQLTSSLVETSEDEKERKKKEETAQKKGLKQKDLDKIIDVNLSETKTICFIDIPSTMVVQESDEDVENQEKNKLYKELIQNKIGSDSYMVRGAQTLNLAQKTKNIHFVGFT